MTLSPLDRARLYRALSYFPELPSAGDLARRLKLSPADAQAVMDSIDAMASPSRTTERMVDECIQRLRSSGDGGEADLDKALDPSALVVPVTGWAGADGQPEWVLPASFFSRSGSSNSRRILFLHGGGYEYYSPSQPYRPLTTRLAAVTGLPVLALDYRLGPANAFPAAVEDALHALDWVWKHGPTPSPAAPAEQSPADAVYVIGDSAGGGLALCLVSAMAMDCMAPGVPLAVHPPPPTALALLSPWTDLTASLESYKTRMWREDAATGDPVFSDGAPAEEIASSVRDAERVMNTVRKAVNA